MTTHHDSQAVLRDRVDAWTRDLAPRNAIETFLTQHAARLSCELDHAAKAEADRTEYLARTAPVEQAQRLSAEVINMGHELIDPSTEVWLQRNPSWAGIRSGKPDADPAPRSPELLVNLLEASAVGCRWLWERWKELAELMDERLTWGLADERKALRLLGMTPDVEDNSAIRELRLTVMAFLGNPSQLTIPEGKSVPGREQAREYIQALCERKMSQLAEREAYLKSIFEDRAGSTRHAFDAGESGKDLRRHLATLHREILKTLETLMKLKKVPVPVVHTEDGERVVRTESSVRTAPPAERNLARRGAPNRIKKDVGCRGSSGASPQRQRSATWGLAPLDASHPITGKKRSKRFYHKGRRFRVE